MISDHMALSNIAELMIFYFAEEIVQLIRQLRLQKIYSWWKLN